MSKRSPQLPGRTGVGGRFRPATSSTSAFGDLAAGGRLRTVALDAVVANPHQPRRRFDEDALQGLAASIAERGVLQPPVVRRLGEEGYELVAGERRCRAARLAGLTEIEVLVGEQDDAASLQDALMENVARQDLSPVDAARAYLTIIEDLGITREELGRRLGLSRVSISNHLRLLDLPDGALDLIDSGRLTFAHGRALLMCADHATRLQLARRAAAEQWSTRQLERAARAAGAPRRGRVAPSADQAAALRMLSEGLEPVCGPSAVTIVPGRRDAYEIRVRCADLDELTATVTRLKRGGGA